MPGKRKPQRKPRTEDIGSYFLRSSAGSKRKNTVPLTKKLYTPSMASGDEELSVTVAAQESSSNTQQSDTVNTADNQVNTTRDTDKILNAIQSLSSKLENLDQKLEAKTKEIILDFSNKIDVVSTKLSEMEGSLNYAHREIEALKEANTKTGTEARHLKERVDNTQKDSKALEKEVENLKREMKDRANDLERYTRKFSVRINNVKDLPQRGHPEMYNRIVAALLVDNKLAPDKSQPPNPWDKRDREKEGTTDANGDADVHDVKVSNVLKEIEISHPIGTRGDQLIVRFHSRPFRNNILKVARAKLSKGDNDLRFVEDLTKMDYEQKKRAIPKMQKAYQEGRKCTFRNGKLIVDGNVVPLD